MLKTIRARLQDYREKIRDVFEPNFERSMLAGLRFLDSERPDIAQGNFLSASTAAPSDRDRAGALVMYAYAAMMAGATRLIDLDDRYTDGTLVSDRVKGAYKTAVQLHPSPEILFGAAVVSVGLEEKDHTAYLEKVIETDDDHLLVKAGRLAKTLELDELVGKVKEKFAARGLHVHLYPV